MIPSETPPFSSPTRWGWCAAGLLFAGVLAWVFRDVLFRGQLLSFRDSLQFYYPLFDFIQQEWEAGRVPLWNPYINCGEPLLAMPTSCVLYPPKALFFLPISYWARYHLYVMGHVIFAGLTCGWVARRWGASVSAATLAALSYAFSGNVLFQYSNIVFLSGAAWLPLALWSGDRMLTMRTLRSIPPFSIVLALMVLAGDPEMAYVAGLLVALHAGLQWWSARRARPASSPTAPVPWRRRRLMLLAFAAIAAIALSAVQVLPTLDWSRESIRSTQLAPLSLYDLPHWFLHAQPPRTDSDARVRWFDGFLGTSPIPAPHEAVLYNYSFAPWRLAELIWPNVSGRSVPAQSSWLVALAWSNTPWAPSQYFGLLPLLLSLSAWRVRTPDDRQRWLSWIALVCLLASFGAYAPGRLFVDPTPAQEGISGPQFAPGSAVGGLYWLCVLLLPGFSDFRFPAKLLVPATCAASLLAARALDGYLRAPRRSLREACGAISAVSGIVAVVAWLNRDAFIRFLDAQPVRMFDFNSAAAANDVLRALSHAVVIAGLLAVLAHVAMRGPGAGRALSPGAGRPHIRLAWPFVLLSGLDLACANGPLVLSTPRADWERQPELIDLLGVAARQSDPDAVRPVRLHRPSAWYYPFLDSLNTEDDPQSIGWQRATLFLNQNLPYRVPIVNGHSTMESILHQAWFETVQVNQDPDVFLNPRLAYDAWGTRSFLLPLQRSPASGELTIEGLFNSWTPRDQQLAPIMPRGPGLSLVPGSDQAIPDAMLLTNDSAFPPAWIVHRVHALEPFPIWDMNRWDELIAKMAFAPRSQVDLRREAFVEDRGLADEFGGFVRAWEVPAAKTESCRLTHYDPLRVELEATLASQGLVVLSEVYTGDWKAEVATDGGPFREQPVLRTNRTMRGVLLPAGKHVVRYSYRPMSFYVGAAISLIALVIAIAAGGVSAWRSRDRRPSQIRAAISR